MDWAYQYFDPCPSRLERRLSDGDEILIVHIQYQRGRTRLMDTTTSEAACHLIRPERERPRLGQVRAENEVQEDRTRLGMHCELVARGA
jgi:hypothetical protein